MGVVVVVLAAARGLVVVVVVAADVDRPTDAPDYHPTDEPIVPSVPVFDWRRRPGNMGAVTSRGRFYCQPHSDIYVVLRATGSVPRFNSLSLFHHARQRTSSFDGKKPH
uniref:Secreted protein n=1 Tax=Plectus sambesii TaxID=2011161 RepID=A0A914VM39_9BILA